MSIEIVGREDELAEIDAFLADEGPRALLIEGEAGIGKTTLWREGVERARERGYAVLRCGPSAAEADIAFAALGDLLGALDRSSFEALPAPQQRAVEGALLLRQVQRPPEGRALALGLVSVLRGLAAERRALVAVDDTQWLDTASRDALTFAFRRIDGVELGVLLARRTAEDDGRAPLDLDRALPPDAFRTCAVAPLSLGALGRLVRQRLDLDLRRPQLLLVHELSGGNPFMALELAPTVADGRPERLPESLSEIAMTRLEPLGITTLEALLVVALSPAPTVELVDELVETDDAWAALEPARAVGVLVLDGRDVRFAHPLYAAAVVERSSPTRRADVHRLLAALAETDELRARHVAASTFEPDADVALQVEAGASAALLRGAPAIGAELAARALELTPEDDTGRARRTMLEAECLQEAGDLDRASALLSALAESTDAGSARAEVLFALARIPKSFGDSITLYEQALAEATGTELAGRIGVMLGTLLFISGRGDRGLAETERAIEKAQEVHDELTEQRARSARAMMVAARGEAWDLETMRRAADLERRVLERPDADGAELWCVQALHFNDLVDEARERARDLRARALQAGDAVAAAEFAAELTTIETRAGRLQDAHTIGLAGLEEAEQIGWELGAGQQLELLALTEAWLGRSDDALRSSERGRELTRAGEDYLGEIRSSHALIVLALGREDWAGAAELADELMSDGPLENPNAMSLFAQAAEAHALLGDGKRAGELTLLLEDAVRIRPTVRLCMEAERCRGVALGLEGDPESAIAALKRALGHAEALGVPHETGRTLLMLGRVHRRSRHKAAARACLERSIAILDESGVSLFAAQARAELARVGGRRSSGDVLTETERRVAELVAEGKSNKETAAALFVTVKAVEANLSRIYAKLGIHSRTELAAALLAQERAESKP